MRINVYDSEFHALQLSGIQFLLPKNKREKIFATANTNTGHFQLSSILSFSFIFVIKYLF